MKKNYKIALMAFSGSLLVLAAFLWMPMLAGPDGLERVLYNLTGNEDYEPESDINYEAAPFPDYAFQFGENGYFQTFLIGLLGASIVAGVMFGVMKLLALKPKQPKLEENSSEY